LSKIKVNKIILAKMGRDMEILIVQFGNSNGRMAKEF